MDDTMSGEDADESNQQTEWWWIDYLENEMTAECENDLQLLLQHSQEDRDSFEKFRLLREWLRGSDPVLGWPVDERLTRVRSKVMQAIELESFNENEVLLENPARAEVGRG